MHKHKYNVKLMSSLKKKLSSTRLPSFEYFLDYQGASLVAQLVKNPPAMQETLV